MEAYIPQDVFHFLRGFVRMQFENLPKYRRLELSDRLAAQCMRFSATWPSFEFNGPQHSTWLYLGIAFFVLCILAQFLDDTPHSNRQNLTRPVFTVYEALATMFTPVSSCHPKHYQPVLAHVSRFLSPSKGKKAIVALDFEKSWKAIVNGHLELKDEAVLEDLFTSNTPGSTSTNINEKSSDDVGVCAFGCIVTFEFAWKWKICVAQRIFYARLQAWMEKCKWHLGWKMAGDVPCLDTCLVDDTLDLDFIPIPYVTSALAAAKRLLALNPTFEYDHLNVEFTYLASDIGFMSKRFLLCCAILLPNLGHNLSRSKKTALPFCVSFTDITRKIEAISSGLHFSSSGSATSSNKQGEKDKTTIRAVKDISMLHADALDLHENDMVFDRWVRSSFVARHGPDAWRETRLRLKWEAALLRAKVLVRWKVTVAIRGSKAPKPQMEGH